MAEDNQFKNMVSIVIHGRGGQGAKTAAMLLAEVAISLGKQAQAFPEYGPERSGAPLKAYVRLSDKPITTHEPVTNPNIVLIIDETLLDFVSVLDGTDDNTTFIINSNNKDSVLAKLKLSKSFKGKIAIVDATSIALNRIGANKSNTPTLAALLKIIELIPFDEFLQKVKVFLELKLGKERTDQNILAMKDAYKGVKLL